MARNKQNDEDIDIFAEDIEDSVDDIEQHAALEGEHSADKSSMEKLIDTKTHLKALEKQFKGYVERDLRWEKVSDEIATNRFIDKMIGGLRSIINPFTIYTYLDESETEKILLEKNEEFIRFCVDEESIDDPNDMTLMVNIYDHALQTFLALATKGHGSIFLRDLGGGLSQGLEHMKDKKQGMLAGLSSMFTIGGNK